MRSAFTTTVQEIAGQPTPLGASTGDWLSQTGNQGLALGVHVTSDIFLGLIVLLVALLQIRKADLTPVELSAADEINHPHLSSTTRAGTLFGEVTVEPGAYDGRALVTVCDDGPGIEPSLGEDIFLPGGRGSAEAGDGAGPGLPLARRLATSCGGEITIGDGPGGCFVLSLPAVSYTSTSPAHRAEVAQQVTDEPDGRCGTRTAHETSTLLYRVKWS